MGRPTSRQVFPSGPLGSGGFEGGGLAPCGHTFSERKPYHALTAQSDCTEMVKKIPYWQSQT